MDQAADDGRASHAIEEVLEGMVAVAEAAFASEAVHVAERADRTADHVNDAAADAHKTREQAAEAAASAIAGVAERAAMQMQAKVDASASALYDTVSLAARDRARAVASGTLPGEAEQARILAAEHLVTAAATALEARLVAAIVAKAVSVAQTIVANAYGVSEHRIGNDVAAARYVQDHETALAAREVESRNGAHYERIALAAEDITDSNRHRRALQDLTAMLAHDLRTPAAVMLGFAELLEGPAGEDAQEVRVCAARISAGARAMTDLLDNALTAASLDSGDLIATPKDVTLRVAIETAVRATDLGPVTIETSALDDVTAWMDPVHLSQVINNLLTNAAKYGGDKVTISATSGQGRTYISIADNGPGVEPDFVPHLFDRFTRSTAARSGRQRGSGLGLYIVRDILAANGGTIRYAASHSSGAEFTVELPATQDAAATSDV